MTNYHENCLSPHSNKPPDAKSKKQISPQGANSKEASRKLKRTGIEVDAMAEKKELEVDDILPYIGEFSRFQVVVETLLCISIVPRSLQVLIMYFAALNSPWRCAANSTKCTFPRNQTFGSDSADYKARCDMARSDWEFVEPKDFSIVTQVWF